MPALPTADPAALISRFPGLVVRPDGFITVPAGELPTVARMVRDELAFNQLMCLSGVDQLELPGAAAAIGVRYFLASTSRRLRLTLSVEVPRDDGSVPTVSDLWPAALFHEREAYDLFGIRFTGHPDLRRLLLPADWVGHPGRRDYVYPATYNGVQHLRDGQRFVAEKKPVKPAAKPAEPVKAAASESAPPATVPKAAP